LPARVFLAFNTGVKAIGAAALQPPPQRNGVFTGIIQALGTVAGVEPTARARASGTHAHRLDVDLGPLADGLQTGASVAIDGVCLTMAELRGTVGAFDVVPETWRRSTLGERRRGDRVHLERSLRVGDPLDGHFVQGHVDAIGTIERTERAAGEWQLWVRVDRETLVFIVPKGSVAVDGTSLTIAEVVADTFSVALVPTTLERTRFATRRPGEHVNIETDILARIVRAQLARLSGDRPATDATALTWQKLEAGGFLP
jgi:riboflavin synthase